MRILNSLKRRAVASLGVVSATAIVLISLSGPAAAQQAPVTAEWPVLQVANPSPGALISNGDYVISGSAFDPAAAQGSGISRVDLFLGDRSQGGVFLGSAVPGQDVMSGLTPGSTTAQNSFQLTVAVPSNMSGGKDFFAYAYSSVTGYVTSVSMPIYIAVVPTVVATPATAPVAEIQHLLPAANEGAQAFSLGNPNAGDVVLNGDYVVSGTTGSAIDRVTFFLDDRDTGGAPLGSVTPANGTFTLTVTLPAWAAGGHTFTAYAFSSTNGQETKVSVPIYVGAAPTPTPRPS